MQTQQIRLGLVGYGEIGSTLGHGSRESGLRDVIAYNKCAFTDPYSGLIQRRTQQADVNLVDDPATLAQQADIIMGMTPGSASLESAAALTPCLTRSHVFVDVASATPEIKREVTFGDASILGTPADGHDLPIIVSCPAADGVRDALVPWGMRIEAIGTVIARASGIKILPLHYADYFSADHAMIATGNKPFYQT